MANLYAGCYTAEWQSRTALQEMADNAAAYPDGPNQEAAMRHIVVASVDEAMAVLIPNKDDIAGDAQIVGPWYVSDESTWEFRDLKTVDDLG